MVEYSGLSPWPVHFPSILTVQLPWPTASCQLLCVFAWGPSLSSSCPAWEDWNTRQLTPPATNGGWKLVHKYASFFLVVEATQRGMFYTGCKRCPGGISPSSSRWKSAWPLPHYWLLLLFLSRFPIRLLPFPSLPSQTSYLHLLLCLQTCSWWNPNGDGEEMTWGLLHHNSRYCSCSCAFLLDLNYLWKETICISSTHVQDLEYLTQYYFMKSLSFNTVNIWHLHSTFELDAILKAVHILPHLLHATTLWEKALTQTESHLIWVLPNTEFY